MQGKKAGKKEKKGKQEEDEQEGREARRRRSAHKLHSKHGGDAAAGPRQGILIDASEELERQLEELVRSGDEIREVSSELSAIKRAAAAAAEHHRQGDAKA